MTNKNVIIVADASYCDRLHHAGFGAILVIGDDYQMIQGGMECHDSTTAEIMALQTALLKGAELGITDANVTLVSDSEHALRSLTGEVSIGKNRLQDRAAYRRVQALAQKYRLKIATQHVRGHQAGREIFVTLQRWCDAAARAAIYMNHAHDALNSIK